MTRAGGRLARSESGAEKGHSSSELELELVLEGRVEALTVTLTHRRPNSVPLVPEPVLWQFEFDDF